MKAIQQQLSELYIKVTLALDAGNIELATKLKQEIGILMGQYILRDGE